MQSSSLVPISCLFLILSLLLLCQIKCHWKCRNVAESEAGRKTEPKRWQRRRKKTISQLSEMERRAECDGSCSNDTTAGVLASPAAPDISQHSRKQRTSKCARFWKRSFPPETLWIHLDPVLQKLRTGCTEGQHLHIFGDTAAPRATTPGDLRDHRKHLPGEGGLQPGNNQHPPPLLYLLAFHKASQTLSPVYSVFSSLILCP